MDALREEPQDQQSASKDLLSAARMVVGTARAQGFICGIPLHQCPCEKDSYNDCGFNWQLSKSILELKEQIDKSR